jgi:hypothetical protein
MTKKVVVEKAGNTPGRPPVEDVLISIHSSGIFEETDFPTRAVFQSDAEDLCEALCNSLPQGTFDRLLALMLQTCAGTFIRAIGDSEENTKHKSVLLAREQLDFLTKAAQMKADYECAEYSPEEERAVKHLIKKLERKA